MLQNNRGPPNPTDASQYHQMPLPFSQRHEAYRQPVQEDPKENNGSISLECQVYGLQEASKLALDNVLKEEGKNIAADICNENDSSQSSSFEGDNCESPRHDQPSPRQNPTPQIEEKVISQKLGVNLEISQGGKGDNLKESSNHQKALKKRTLSEQPQYQNNNHPASHQKQQANDLFDLCFEARKDNKLCWVNPQAEADKYVDLADDGNGSPVVLEAIANGIQIVSQNIHLVDAQSNSMYQQEVIKALSVLQPVQENDGENQQDSGLYDGKKKEDAICKAVEKNCTSVCLGLRGRKLLLINWSPRQLSQNQIEQPQILIENKKDLKNHCLAKPPQASNAIGHNDNEGAPEEGSLDLPVDVQIYCCQILLEMDISFAHYTKIMPTKQIQIKPVATAVGGGVTIQKFASQSLVNNKNGATTGGTLPEKAAPYGQQRSTAAAPNLSATHVNNIIREQDRQDIHGKKHLQVAIQNQTKQATLDLFQPKITAENFVTAEGLFKISFSHQSLSQNLGHSLKSPAPEPSGVEAFTLGFSTLEEMKKWEALLSRHVIQGEIWERYQFKKLIGEGASSKVFLAAPTSHKKTQTLNKSDNHSNMHGSAGTSKQENVGASESIKNNEAAAQQTNEMLAVKVLNKKRIQSSPTGVHNIVQEIRVHWELEDCDGILKLVEIFEDDQLLYLVLEYQQRGSLLTEMMKQNFMNEAQIRVVLEQLLLTLDFIHEKGIVHRDIKLDNILIHKIEESEYDVKIADFGLAAFIPKDNKKLHQKCGTPGYAAPEILRGQGYTQKCDIFSMGVVFFNVLTGCYLFAGNDDQDILYKNKMCQVDDMIVALSGISAQCKDVLAKMLCADPDKRPNVREILSHLWFKEDNVAIQDLLAMNSSMVNKDFLSHSLLAPSIKPSGLPGQPINVPYSVMHASALFSVTSGNVAGLIQAQKDDQNSIGNSFSSFVIGNNAFGRPQFGQIQNPAKNNLLSSGVNQLASADIKDQNGQAKRGTLGEKSSHPAQTNKQSSSPFMRPPLFKGGSNRGLLNGQIIGPIQQNKQLNMLSPNLNQQQKRQLSNYRGGIQVAPNNSGGHALHHLSNSPLLLRSGFKAGVEQTPSPNPNRMSFSLKWNGFLNQNQNTSQMSFGGILGGNTAGGNGSTNRGLNYLKHIKHQRSLSNNSNLQFKHLTPPMSQQQNANGLQSEQQQNRSGRHDTLPSNERKGILQQDSVMQDQANSLKIVIPDYNQCPVEISLKESERSHSIHGSLQHTIQTPQTSSPSNLLLQKPQLQNQKKKSMFYKEDKNRSANTRNAKGLAPYEEVKKDEGEHLSQDSFEEDAQQKDNIQQERQRSSNQSQGKKLKCSAEHKLDDLRNSDDPDISKEEVVKPLNLENPIFPKKFESVSIPNQISGEQAIKREPDFLNVNSRSVKNKRIESGGSMVSSDEQPSLIPIERSFYKYSEYNYLKSMGKDPLQGVTSFNAQSAKNQDMAGITTTMNNQQVGGGGLISNYLIGNKDAVQQHQKYGLGVNDALNGKRMSGSRPGVGPNQSNHTAQNLQNNVSHFTFRQGQVVIQTSEVSKDNVGVKNTGGPSGCANPSNVEKGIIAYQLSRHLKERLESPPFKDSVVKQSSIYLTNHVVNVTRVIPECKQLSFLNQPKEGRIFI